MFFLFKGLNTLCHYRPLLSLEFLDLERVVPPPISDTLTKINEDFVMTNFHQLVGFLNYSSGIKYQVSAFYLGLKKSIPEVFRYTQKVNEFYWEEKFSQKVVQTLNTKFSREAITKYL